jgi:hypothetical protein
MEDRKIENHSVLPSGVYVCLGRKTIDTTSKGGMSKSLIVTLHNPNARDTKNRKPVYRKQIWGTADYVKSWEDELPFVVALDGKEKNKDGTDSPFYKIAISPFRMDKKDQKLRRKMLSVCIISMFLMKLSCHVE